MAEGDYCLHRGAGTGNPITAASCTIVNFVSKALLPLKEIFGTKSKLFVEAKNWFYQLLPLVFPNASFTTILIKHNNSPSHLICSMLQRLQICVLVKHSVLYWLRGCPTDCQRHGQLLQKLKNLSSSLCFILRKDIF